MNYIKKRWVWILSLVMVMTLVFVTPAFAQDGTPPSDEVVDLTLGINILWMILGGFLVFFMQAGFALVETGFTRNKNVAHTMMTNMMVFCIGAVGYWLVGFAFQFGGVNAAYPAVSTVGADAGEWAHSLITMVDMDTAATIPTGSMAERLQFVGFVFMSL